MNAGNNGVRAGEISGFPNPFAGFVFFFFFLECIDWISWLLCSSSVFRNGGAYLLVWALVVGWNDGKYGFQIILALK